jgi:hypothetical protein
MCKFANITSNNPKTAPELTKKEVSAIKFVCIACTCKDVQKKYKINLLPSET